MIQHACRRCNITPPEEWAADEDNSRQPLLREVNMGPGRIACLCQTCHFEWERFEESSRAYREFIKVKTRLEAFLNCLANHCRPEGLSSFYGELDRHCDAVHDAELALANQVDAWLEKDDLFSPPIDDDYDED